MTTVKENPLKCREIKHVEKCTGGHEALGEHGLFPEATFADSHFFRLSQLWAAEGRSSVNFKMDPVYCPRTGRACASQICFAEHHNPE